VAWSAPYRAERIYDVIGSKAKLNPVAFKARVEMSFCFSYELN
jgi:hypothetical protein